MFDMNGGELRSDRRLLHVERNISLHYTLYLTPCTYHTL